MKIAIYLTSISTNKNAIKLAVLRRFGAGISKSTDQVEFVNGHDLIDCEVAVLLGFVHNDISSPHLQLRKKVLNNHKNIIIIDSNLFQFANAGLANYYLRYSLNDVFPDTGFYFDNKISRDRWRSISQRLGIALRDYRKGKHILICLQRVDGWSMDGTDVQNWLDRTVAEIRKHTDRPILVRKHPGDRRQQTIRIDNRCRISNSASILEDLDKAHATVTFNSSPGVASLIEGVPAFVTDPKFYRSQTYPICNTSLDKIENPEQFDRDAWIHRICQSHWNEDEIRSGDAWKFMRERLGILKPSLF